MISDRELQHWIDFLGQQMVALDAEHEAITGKRHVASVELVAFLKMNDGLVKARVEQAIAEFIEAGDWPSSLTGDEIVNLTHRANAPLGLLHSLLKRQVQNVAVLRMPQSSDRANFVRWLFIDCWNRGGAAYLEALTNTYLAEHCPR